MRQFLTVVLLLQKPCQFLRVFAFLQEENVSNFTRIKVVKSQKYAFFCYWRFYSPSEHNTYAKTELAKGGTFGNVGEKICSIISVYQVFF